MDPKLLINQIISVKSIYSHSEGHFSPCGLSYSFSGTGGGSNIAARNGSVAVEEDAQIHDMPE